MGMLYPYRGYVIDAGANYLPTESAWVGCFNIYSDGHTIHRVEQTGDATTRQAAEDQALVDGKAYVNKLPPKAAIADEKG
jgi:hypothetical protein